MKSTRRWLSCFACSALTLLTAEVGRGQPLLELTGATVGTTQVLRIEPSGSDNWAFSQIWEFAEDSNRQLYVLDELELRIFVINAVGKLVRTLGREGSGPGEFRRPKGLQIFGDTVFVLRGVAPASCR